MSDYRQQQSNEELEQTLWSLYEKLRKHMTEDDKALFRHISGLREPPYQIHCFHPQKCAGKNTCQRDICCID